MLQMGEKQQWSNEHLKCLLETCIEEHKGTLPLHVSHYIML
ncbi:hypothetical protein HanRHA438_Chr03g0143511 [Helianthus annuus]|nr:hypothetical protein HanRHA438_Chr03g0143511 [Helianthus annuus]